MKIQEDYLKLLNAEFLLRFKGYCQLPRSRYFLYLNKHLNDAEFILYSMLFDTIADWDNRHGKYGTFDFDYDIFAQQINWSVTKVRRIIKSLINKKFIVLLAPKKFTIVGFELRSSISKEGFNFYDEIQNKILHGSSDKSSDENEINGTRNNN